MAEEPEQIRQTVSRIYDPAFSLLSGEIVEFECGLAIPMALRALIVVVCFAPPFFVLWGIALYLLVRQNVLACHIAVTDRHLLAERPHLLFRRTNTLIPLSKIRAVGSPSVQIEGFTRFNTGFFGFGGLSGRLFGSGTVMLVLDDKKSRVISIHDVRRPSDLIAHVRRKTSCD